MAILDWIYPKKCLGCGAYGKYICANCQRRVESRGSCLRYEGVVRQAIKEIKYRGTYDIVRELVEIWNPEKPEGELVVTAVPMWRDKQKKRGYNQAELIAREVCRRWGVEYMGLLIRTRETRPMYGLGRSERMENVRGAFLLNPKFKISNSKRIKNDKPNTCKIILIDDVWTSGATVYECTKVLNAVGITDVLPLTLAT